MPTPTPRSLPPSPPNTCTPQVAEKDKTLLVACADGRYQEAVEKRVESLKVLSCPRATPLTSPHPSPCYLPLTLLKAPCLVNSQVQLGEKLAAAKEFEAQRLEQRITKLRGIAAGSDETGP